MSSAQRFLPISIRLKDRPVLVVGGGEVALRKVKILLDFDALLTVCAPCIHPEIEALAIRILRQPFTPDAISDHSLVYAATNKAETNRDVAREARKKGAWVNVVDDPDHSDFISPARFEENGMSVAVSSHGRDVRKSIAWRNRIRELVKHDHF